MNIVLMDTKHHRVVALPFAVASCLFPVETREGPTEAEFAMTGDKLYGDPVFYQVRGPELPASWWHQDVMRMPFRMYCDVQAG